jgi:hypothetical protein
MLAGSSTNDFQAGDELSGSHPSFSAWLDC